MTVDPDVALARSFDDDASGAELTITETCAILKRKMEQRKHARPLCYVAILPRLIEVARQLGYALCVHGSLVRDLDLVAAPWVEDAAGPVELVAAIAQACGGVFVANGEQPSQKPHGRLAWTIHTGAEMYVDLSVMPLVARAQR